jgi:hypothetical protein
MGAKRKYSKELWDRVDWNLTAKEISQLTGASLTPVYTEAEERGIRLKPGKRGGRAKVNYEALDWNKSLVQLSRELRASGVKISPQRLGQKNPNRKPRLKKI